MKCSEVRAESVSPVTKVVAGWNPRKPLKPLCFIPGVVRSYFLSFFKIFLFYLLNSRFNFLTEFEKLQINGKRSKSLYSSFNLRKAFRLSRLFLIERK